MTDYKKISIRAGYKLNDITGELEEIPKHLVNHTQSELSKVMTSKYSQKSIDTARKVTSELCEKCVSSTIGGKRTESGNTKGYDIIDTSGRKIEAKMGRIGKHAVIKQKQVNEINHDDFYAILYYRTTLNKVPSYFTDKSSLKINPETYLLRNISLEHLFLFPRDVIAARYNTANICEGIISTTGLRHKALPYKRAIGLAEENPSQQSQYEYRGEYKRHNFPITTIGYRI